MLTLFKKRLLSYATKLNQAQTMNFDQVGEQLCLAEEFNFNTEPPLLAKRASPLPEEASNPIRHALEKRYRKVLVERRDYRQLVTYVPNKNCPSITGSVIKKASPDSWF